MSALDIRRLHILFLNDSPAAFGSGYDLSAGNVACIMIECITAAAMGRAGDVQNVNTQSLL